MTHTRGCAHVVGVGDGGSTYPAIPSIPSLEPLDCKPAYLHTYLTQVMYLTYIAHSTAYLRYGRGRPPPFVCNVVYVPRASYLP